MLVIITTMIKVDLKQFFFQYWLQFYRQILAQELFKGEFDYGAWRLHGLWKPGSKGVVTDNSIVHKQEVHRRQPQWLVHKKKVALQGHCQVPS